MKSLAPLLSIIALAFGLVGCPGGGGGGGSSADFAVSTTAADFGVVGNAYTSTLAVTGGTAPFTWTLFGGALPTGLPNSSLNAGTGVVSGTPTAAGNFTATFTVTDSTGQAATGSVLFAVHPRTDRVSVNGSGTAGSGVSSAPSISGDGSLVAFASSSANFVAGVNGTQIYLHNRQTNQIEVISRDSDANVINEGGGASSDPSMSADGRFVAFVSQSTNLVAGVSGQQVYLRDRQTGQTTLISKSSSGVTSNGGVNSSPAISSDGRYIAFVSVATNLGVAGGNQQIYLHDRVTGITSLISKDNNAVPGDGTSATPAINADGRYIAFASVSTNLGTAGGSQQIYIHDRLTGTNGTTSLVSKDSGATAGNGNSSAPSVSGDGRYVAFVSLATNIVTGFSGQQVYIHDRNTGANGTNSLISRDNSGSPNAGNHNSSAPSISSDGRYVAFTSLATNLLATVNGQQIYLHDRNGPATSLVSRDNTGSLVEGNGLSDTPSINSDGGFVAFTSQASNLLAGGVAPSDIYIRALP